MPKTAKADSNLRLSRGKLRFLPTCIESPPAIANLAAVTQSCQQGLQPHFSAEGKHEV